MMKVQLIQNKKTTTKGQWGYWNNYFLVKLYQFNIIER